MYYVYVLKNPKGHLYYGYTNNLKRRLWEHNNSRGAVYTKNSKWLLIYYEAYLEEADARERENQIKQHGQAIRRLKGRLKQSLKQVLI
jgi:putative endonuclease